MPPKPPAAGAVLRPVRRDAPQPLGALEFDDALLKIQTVVAVTGLSTASVYRKVKGGDEGSFPQPIRLGARCTRFRAGDVKAWLAKQAGKA